MSPFRFRWGAGRPSEEDHHAPVWPRTFRLPVAQRGPDWQRPVEPLDPCGTSAPPVTVKNAATRRRK